MLTRKRPQVQSGELTCTYTDNIPPTVSVDGDEWGVAKDVVAKEAGEKVKVGSLRVTGSVMMTCTKSVAQNLNLKQGGKRKNEPPPSKTLPDPPVLHDFDEKPPKVEINNPKFKVMAGATCPADRTANIMFSNGKSITPLRFFREKVEEQIRARKQFVEKCREWQRVGQARGAVGERELTPGDCRTRKRRWRS